MTAPTVPQHAEQGPGRNDYYVVVRRRAEEALAQWDLPGVGDALVSGLAIERIISALRDLLAAGPKDAAIKESLKTAPTIPDGDLAFDALDYARTVLSDPDHRDADEFSACARETLAAMLGAFDRLRQRHDTLSRNHTMLMYAKAPVTNVTISDEAAQAIFATKAPAPPLPDEVREAAEVRRLLPGWIERDICDWQFRCAVEDMLAALDAAGGKP